MAEPLFQQLQKLQDEFQGHPPVSSWDPDLCGDMDMLIRADGRWIHEGTEIQRQPLVKLFASILKKEGRHYYLVTPVEKWRIRVEDVPFLITQAAREGEGVDGQILLTTNTADVIPLDKEHPLSLKPYGDPPQPVPYVEVRNGLQGRMSRDVYYQLIDWAEPRQPNEPPAKLCQLWLLSKGEEFLLGQY
ncbi:DUF1285 domain-containing protein [Microbulbifer sp. HZ11]|uniref:DUF1285 domain-containing protein n=1 Tax=unclassified Microbulbifer TaxID=2619833 RepID=UPI000690BCB9|nr:DUF1285 domain-containing protein [Microbulbifer sp. HZ11]